MRKAEVVAAGLIFVASFLVFYGSKDFPTIPRRLGGSPDFYPRILAFTFAGLGSLLLLRNVRGPRRWEKESAFTLPSTRTLTSLVLLISLLLAMPYLVKLFGFLLANFLFLVVVMLKFKPERLTARWTCTTVVLSAGVIGAVYAVFVLLVKVQLPAGLLFGG